MRWIALLICLALPAAAQDLVTIGTARLFTNDVIGDGYDRWRTGSYQFSLLRAPRAMDRDQPQGFLEYRFRSDIFAPSYELPNGTVDRPYAGALSFGLHAHTRQGPWDASVGVDAMVIGPVTGLSALQDRIHDSLSLPTPLGTRDQLPDAVHFGGAAELALRWQPVSRLTLRPFAAAMTGPEDLVRVGADIIWGAVGHQATYVRDVGTGTVMPGAGLRDIGWSLIAGADVAQVRGSVLLPANRGVIALDQRRRARIGVLAHTRSGATLFAGLTWLSPEFLGQPEGQVLGSLRVNFRF